MNMEQSDMNVLTVDGDGVNTQSQQQAFSIRSDPNALVKLATAVFNSYRFSKLVQLPKKETTKNPYRGYLSRNSSKHDLQLPWNSIFDVLGIPQELHLDLEAISEYLYMSYAASLYTMVILLKEMNNIEQKILTGIQKTIDKMEETDLSEQFNYKPFSIMIEADKKLMVYYHYIRNHIDSSLVKEFDAISQPIHVIHRITSLIKAGKQNRKMTADTANSFTQGLKELKKTFAIYLGKTNETPRII